MTASFHDFGFLGQGTYDHGTRKNYAAGCRCTPCRAAESAYQCQRARARAQGEGDPRGWVDAGPSRDHIAALRASGVGFRQIAALSQLAPATIQAIQHGQPRVTPATEARILQVSQILAGGAIVNGYRTFDRLRILLKEGYSAEQVREWVGFDVRRRYKGVTARKASRVKALFDRLTAE